MNNIAPQQPTPGFRPTFGVPYARVVAFSRNGETVECPRCGERITNRAAKDFESFAGREYADHYNALHAADDGRVLVDGSWFEREDCRD